MKKLVIAKKGFTDKVPKYSFKDIENLKVPFGDKDVLFMQDWIRGNQGDSDYLIEDFEQHTKKLFKILKSKTNSKVYVDSDGLLVRLLHSSANDEDFKRNYFPIPVEVSSDPKDRMSIGILVHENGKIEEFEGNDEASSETHELVNDLLGIGNKEVRVFANHTSDIVRGILDSGVIPEGLYVSPSRKYAEGYFGEDRELFTAMIRLRDVNRESEVDWITNKDAKVSKVRAL